MTFLRHITEKYGILALKPASLIRNQHDCKPVLILSGHALQKNLAFFGCKIYYLYIKMSRRCKMAGNDKAEKKIED